MALNEKSIIVQGAATRHDRVAVPVLNADRRADGCDVTVVDNGDESP